MQKAENMESKRLVDTEEAARVLGVTARAIRKKFNKGKLEGEFVSNKRGGRGGQVLMVWIDPENTQSAPRGVPRGVGEAATPQGGTPQGKDRYKVHRGEPGCRVVTPLINGIPQSAESIAHSDNESDSPQIVPSSSPPSPCEVIIPPSQGPFLPAPSKFHQITVSRAPSPKSEREGYLKLAILNAYRQKISENHKPKGHVTEEFLEVFNSGLFLPHIYNDTGRISRSTLYTWDLAEKTGGIKALIPCYGGARGSEITEQEKYILLNCLLHQNRLKIGTAIKFTKTFLAYKKMPSPSSESKLRRFADEFKKTHYPTWVLGREGAKALNDKKLPYAERNWRFLAVGEGLVADGHRLNFRVIDPFTGKPCRATIVLFWDWKSSYPLGWEIMIEENVQCIASALRNAILTLGKIPKWLLIDNGKAFKAKAFTSEMELEDGILYGMFATLGIHTHFSQAYNPQEKPLERFWGTFNNWFERLFDSYSGASIEDKPAWMRRNEKDAQTRHGKYVPRIEEVQELLHKWISFYASQPSRGRDGKTPGEIFQAEKGPGVDPAELYHLMMVKEKMAVGRNGVTFNGWHYYDEALSDIKDYVVGKYSLSDYSQIYCFYKNEFRCVAKPIEPVHPMACESEYPKDQEAVKRIAALKGRVRRTAKNLLGLIESGKDIDLGRARSPEVAEVVKAIEDGRKPIKMTTAFVDDEGTSAECGMRNAELAIPDKDGIMIDPRTGLSRPADGTVHEDQWEKYDWYMTVKKENPKILTNLDHEWIAEYEATDQWKRIYKPIQARG